MSTYTPTYSIDYNCKLTEDYIHTQNILASAAAATPMATFVNAAGQSEALLVHDDGELCHLQREPLSSSGWNVFGIGAVVQQIAAGSSGNVWLTDNAENIWQSNAGHWNLIASLDVGLTGISVGQDGTVYAVGEATDKTTHLFVYDATNATFTDSGPTVITSAPMGNSGSLWAIANGEVYMNGPGAWTQAPGSFASGDVPQQVSVGSDGSVWVLCADGAVYAYNASSQVWTPLAGVPQGAGVIAAATAELLYAQIGGQIQSYANGAWSPVTPPQYELAGRGISVAPDGTLWALDAFGTVWRSAAGTWVRQITPTDLSGHTGGHQVTEVVTGRHADGVQYAFYVMDGTLWCSALDMSKAFGGYWSEGVQVYNQPCSHFGATVAPSNNALVVYGTTADGDFLVVENVNGVWTPKLVPTKVGQETWPIANTMTQYVSTGAGAWFLFFVSGSTLCVAIAVGVGGEFGTVKEFPLPGGLGVQALVPFSTTTHGQQQGALYTCVLDGQGQLWSVSMAAFGAPATYTQLSGPAVGSPIGPVVSAVAITSDQTSAGTGARVFARDNNNMLWIIRVAIQDKVLTWGEWHPLGDPCSFLANGPTDSTSSELFMLDEGGEVAVLSEDVTNGVWNELMMLKPAGTNVDAEYVSRYVTELTVTDEHSAPQANFTVQLTADEPTGVWVGTTLYNVGVTEPAQLTTDTMGKLTFAFFAGDIHTPTFTVAAAGLADAPSIYPAQGVNDYLAGKGGALPGKPDFDAGGKALGAAVMQTAPEWANNSTTPFVQSQDQANAPAAAQAITQVYAMPTSSTGTPGQWSAPDPQAAGVGSSHFWNDVCKYGHDIEHAVKKGVMKVKTIAVDVEHGLVSFTMELANGLTSVLNLVVATVRDIVAAVKCVFRFIERGIDEAIHWLKSLFQWHDVLNTKNVIETLLNGLLTRLNENLDPNSPVYAGTLFKTYFDGLVSHIQGGFTNAANVFSKTQTFSSTTSAVPYPAAAQPMGSDALHPTGVQNAQSANGTHANYVHTHTSNYAAQGGTLPASAMGDGTSGDGVLQSLFDSITNNLGQDPYKTAHLEAVGNLQTLFSNPKQFADVVIFDVITAVDKAVMALLDVVESVVEALIALAGNAMRGMQALFGKRIDIPVISWLWAKISGHPLTMLDLLSLGMALPTTLLYKLTFGMPNLTPPFTDASAQALVDQFSNPATFPWPDVATNGTVSAAPGSGVGGFPTPVLQFLMPAMTAAYAFFDVACDVTAYKNNRITPFPEKLPPSVVDTFLSQFNVLIGAACFVGFAPWSLFNKSGGRSSTDNVTLANWALSVVPVLAGAVFTFGSFHKATTEFNTEYGLLLSGGVGILLLAMGIATSVTQAVEDPHNYGPFYWAQNVIAPIPTIFKFLVATQGDPPAPQAAIGALAVGDVLFDGANGALAYCEDLL